MSKDQNTRRIVIEQRVPIERLTKGETTLGSVIDVIMLRVMQMGVPDMTNLAITTGYDEVDHVVTVRFDAPAMILTSELPDLPPGFALQGGPASKKK